MTLKVEEPEAVGVPEIAPVMADALAKDPRPMKLAEEAMKRAGTTDGPKLREAIAATKDHDGITGKITLDAQRNASKPAVILTVKSGKFKFVELVKPE